MERIPIAVSLGSEFLCSAAWPLVAMLVYGLSNSAWIAAFAWIPVVTLLVMASPVKYAPRIMGGILLFDLFYDTVARPRQKESRILTLARICLQTAGVFVGLYLAKNHGIGPRSLGEMRLDFMYRHTIPQYDMVYVLAFQTIVNSIASAFWFRTEENVHAMQLNTVKDGSLLLALQRGIIFAAMTVPWGGPGASNIYYMWVQYSYGLASVVTVGAGLLSMALTGLIGNLACEMSYSKSATIA